MLVIGRCAGIGAFRHHKFRAALRAFFDAEVRPDAADDDEAGEGPTLELNQKMGRAGVLAAVVGLVPIGEMCGIALPGGVPCKRGVRVWAMHDSSMHDAAGGSGNPTKKESQKDNASSRPRRAG